MDPLRLLWEAGTVANTSPPCRCCCCCCWPPRPPSCVAAADGCRNGGCFEIRPPQALASLGKGAIAAAAEEGTPDIDIGPSARPPAATPPADVTPAPAPQAPTSHGCESACSTLMRREGLGTSRDTRRALAPGGILGGKSHNGGTGADNDASGDAAAAEDDDVGDREGEGEGDDGGRGGDGEEEA